ncbi:autotransporter-associated beta strand repeat-containing protein [Prosthecobacter sp. SYSU 5D2]|uniref:autotransporter-associated beta strand repeat-containing protein n=1 Tax=Prosthecobacter sp. SYSU 5D2 TaxID=3134134 RepID=UPI0031FE4797
MNTNPPNPGVSAVHAAVRLATCVSVVLLGQPFAAMGQVPTSIDASSRSNADVSWETGMVNYSQTTIAQATATAARTGTVVTSLTLTNAGANYTPGSQPTVRFTGGGAGSGATATATVGADGKIATLTLTNGGSGYTSNPTVEIAAAPGGIGSSIRFNNDITGNRTLTLDGNRTVGRMILGDLNTSNRYTIAQGSGGSLIFNNAGNGGGAFLSKFTGNLDTISAPITLNDRLNVRITTNRIVMSNTITGNGNKLTSYGNGILELTGDNTNSNFHLHLWNKGVNNANPQVLLNAETGNAAGGNITIGNASRGTSGHAVLQLNAGRDNLDQISDTATVMFDSFAGSGRNNYFKLMGGDETVGRIVDLGSLAVIENREGESVGTGARLTIAGAGNSYVSGFIRDNTGGATAQADADGINPGNNALGLTMNGAGTLFLSGGNISFTGGMTIGSNSTVNMRQTTNFRSDIINNGTLIMDTGTLGVNSIWNFRKTFAAATEANPKNLNISGGGSLIKTGQANLNLTNTNLGGSLSVQNGTLNLYGTDATTYFGAGVTVGGDAGLARNLNFYGLATIGGGGLNAVGRFNFTNSAIRVQSAVYSAGDQEPSFAQDGVLTMNGDMHLTYMDLRLGGTITITKTSGAAVSNNTRVTVTESSNILAGMRVESTAIPQSLQPVIVMAVDPETRVVTLDKNVNIPAGTALRFLYDSHSSGVLASGGAGGVQNITLVSRPGAIGAATTSGALYLDNNEFSNNTDRVPDTTSITLNGGQIELINDASRFVFAERLGAVTLNQGNSRLTVYRSADSAQGQPASSTLTLASLTRSYGTTVDFAARQLLNDVNTVVTSESLGLNARSRILVDGGLAMKNGIVGGWAYADYEFVKYNTLNGVTPLLASDYETATPAGLSSTAPSTNWTYTRNVKAGAVSTATTSVTGKVAVNSFNIRAGTDVPGNRTVTLSANAVLSIESGGLLSSNGNNTINGNGTSGYVTVGTPKNTPAELFVTVGTPKTNNNASVLTMNSAIRDFIHTQTAAGVTMPSGSNTMTVPANLYVMLMVGMEVRHTNLPSGTVITAINRSASGGTTITLSNAPTVAVSSGAGANRVEFLGGSVGLTKSGPGTLLLSTTHINDYTGPTIINNGILSLRTDNNLGAAPDAFVSNHLQLNGGTLQFRREAVPGVLGDLNLRESDFKFSFTDGNRGISVGESGGRLEVGHVNPNPYYTLNAAGTATTANVVLDVNITNAIDAQGLLELAVRGSPNLPNGEFNKLVLGTVSSTNSYRGGIKTEGTFEGMITINGNNFINGLLMEGARMTIAHDNDFSGPIRLQAGQLTLNGSNTYNGQPNFTETILVGSAASTGILTLGTNSALGTQGFKINLGNTSQLRLMGTNQTLLSIAGEGNSIISNFYSRPAGTPATMDRPSVLTVDLAVNEIYNGVLNNGGTSRLELVKTGEGRLSLTNAGSGFSGKVSILQGMVNVNSIARTGTSSSLGRGVTGAASEILIDGGGLSFTPTGLQTTDRSFTMGAGTEAAILVALGTTQASRVIIGEDITTNRGAVNETRRVSSPVGFSGDGARTLTLSGVNLGDNEFRLQLSDKSVSEPTSLMKMGPGVWALGAASDYSGQTTLQEGVLAILSNNTLGTTAIPTTVNTTTSTLTGNLPNGVAVSFPRFVGTRLPGGIIEDREYFVVESDSESLTFRVAETRGGDPISLFDLPSGPPVNVRMVPNIQTEASTVANAATDTFTGNLANGTAVVFGYQVPLRNKNSNTVITTVLPGGISATEIYYVVEATGTEFKVSTSLEDPTPVNLTTNSIGPIYYQTAPVGNTSHGINLVGGRLDLRDVDYMTPETITFQGGALSLPEATNARWAGNWNVQANSVLTIAAGSELVMDGNLLGTRALTQLGEGTIRLRGESIMPTQPNTTGNEGDNNRRNYTLQAGTLILDYTLNNNSKLVDSSALVLGGGRRGGDLILQGGSHEEVVSSTTVATGASRIFRLNDGGTSNIRLNSVSRQIGASLYFDLARIATVNNLNTPGGILGGWAIIREAVTPATYVIPGTVSRNFVVDVESDVLAVPTPVPFNPVQAVHYLVDGTPVRLTTTGTLPAPLVTGQTYYVVAAGNTTFKLSATLNGAPLDLLDAGSPGPDNQHTVSTYQPKRTSPASILFTANQNTFPGAMGNGRFIIQITRLNTSGNISSVRTTDPITEVLTYNIQTTNTVNSASAIVAHVNLDINVANLFSARISSPDNTPDTGNVAPGALNGGSNDNGNQGLTWAMNGSNTPDGWVQTFSDYSSNTWTRDRNTDVRPVLLDGTFAPIDPTGNEAYSLRFASNAPGVVNLSRDEAYTLQSGAILVSPTVGQNDSSILGQGTLTTENSGNIGGFLVHQYNELGDLVIGVNLANRAEIIRSGRLTSGDARILSAMDFASSSPALPEGDPQELIGATVTVVSGTNHLPAGTVVESILPEGDGVRLSNATTGGDVRTQLRFTKGADVYLIFATQQSATTQNRINGIVNADGVMTTADIYLGMPVVGPGIPAGAVVDFIPDTGTDIRINTNHFNNGIYSTFKLIPTLGLDKLGGGTLVLSGENTYTGITFLADGVIRALKLTDGGVAGSLGASSVANANLNFNGGTLQYTGENTSTNRGMTISDFARINIGHEKTTAVFSGGISLSGTIGAADRLEKTGSGTLEMRGSASLNELAVLEGKLRVQVVDLNALPQTTSASGLAVNGLASVRMGGGTLEMRGLPEADATQNFGGTMFLDEGSSTIRAVSVEGFNSNNLSLGALPRATSLILMGGEETATVQRASGGTVLFVESPEANAGTAGIFLNTATTQRARILPWAVYEDTSNALRPGVNDFAVVSLTTGGIQASDLLQLHQINDLVMNANNWGVNEPGRFLNASEGGIFAVSLFSGVTATAGSPQLVVNPQEIVSFNELRLGMRVSGLGIPADTVIAALDTSNLIITLNNPVEESSTNGSYFFQQERTFFGTIGSSNPGDASYGENREINTLRYASAVDSTIEVSEGSTLTFVSGAILVGSSTRGGAKSILGGGNITSQSAAGLGTDFVVHNYNPVAPFTIGANIVDNVLQSFYSANGTPPTAVGTVVAGQALIVMPEAAFTLTDLIHEGMEVTGFGLPEGTFVTGKFQNQIMLSKAAESSGTGQLYTFYSTTSFVQTGTGTTILSGSNLYSGKTFVHGGVLRLDSAMAVPGGIKADAEEEDSSHMVVKGGVVGLGFEDFTRFLGTGESQIEFKGSGGFAAYGADRLVDFGAEGVARRIRFGNDGFVTDGSSLVLGAVDATHKVTMVNSIDLGSFSQAIRVDNGPADIEGELSGVLYGVGKLIKFGMGSLRLSGQNQHTGGIDIADGRLVVADVPDALGLGDGRVTLGTSYTNTSATSAIELTFEGGSINKDIVIGNVNARTTDWVVRKEVGGPGGNDGTHSSMILVNGNPAIAYYDPVDQNLKFVRANDPRGVTWLPPVTLADRGNVGQYPSLAIINNNPAVTYYDATNGTLCYVRANDISGVVWGVPVIADADPVSAVALQPADGKIIIGGTFVEFDGVTRTRLARLLPNGTVDPSFSPSVDGEVRDIVVLSDNTIVIGGNFERVNNTVRNNIARLTSDGTLTSYNPNANGVVNTLVVVPAGMEHAGKILVGGAFTNIGGSGRGRLARLNNDGTADTTLTNPSANGEVFAIALESDGDILMGGSFTSVRGSERNRLARISATGALDTFNPNANGTVRAIVVTEDSIYVGGAFATLTGTGSTATVTRNRLARLDLAGVVDKDYAIEVNAEVRGMRRLEVNGKIALYGVFTQVGQTPINSLARLNADGELDVTFVPNPDYEVKDVVEQPDGMLVVGGLFSRLSGATQHFAGRVDLGGSADLSFARKVNDRGQYSSLTAVAAFPAVSYHDSVRGNVRYSRAANISGTVWGDSMAVLTPGNNGRNSVMRVANIGGDLVVKNPDNDTITVSNPRAINGTPAIAYFDPTSDSLKYVLSSNALGTDWSRPVVVDANGNVGSHLSMELVNGFPAIAYYNSSEGDLQYIRATNTAGMTNNLRTPDGSPRVIGTAAVQYDPAWGVPQKVDTNGTVGQYPSLTLIKDKSPLAVITPAIAYYDLGGGNLKYVRATNANGEGTAIPLVPGWGTPVTVQSAGNVGQYAQLVITEGVPGMSYYDQTEDTLKFVHFSEAAGYSKMAAAGDTVLEGNIDLMGSLLFAPEAGTLLTLNGALTGSGGFRLISEGSLLINSSDNQFGSAYSGDESPVTIRTGSLLLGSATALGGNRVDLGDRSGNLRPANPDAITVPIATNGTRMTLGGGRFDTDHNGLVDNANGTGAFVNVSSTVDGVAHTQADAGKLILVKDEAANPGRNGVYRIVYAASQPEGTMNLVRIDELNELAEFVYGFQVNVSGGSSAGRAFFLSSLVKTVNTSPVQWSEVLTVDRATTGVSLVATAGAYDTSHNGIVANAGGPGAFVAVDTEIDGRTYSVEDEGTLILVKDELRPEFNGVYRIQYGAGVQPDGTMNLVRAADMDELAEFRYGMQVRVANGTYAGEAFFLASKISEMNISPVLWLSDVPDGDLALRANESGMTITSVIDLNSRLGAGNMVLGAAESLLSGTVNFTGPITLQDNQVGFSERQALALDSNLMSDYGVNITGLISEERGTGSSITPADVLSLVKTGDGVVTLRGANTFHGGVTVNDGTLLVMNQTGSGTGTGAVTVNAGAVLGGMGTITGPVLLNGTGSALETRATLRVGDPNVTTGTEIMTLSGGLTVGPNSVVEFTLGVNNVTRLAANSVSVTPTGRLLVAFGEGFTPLLQQAFDIFDGTINFTAGTDILLSEYLKLPGAYVWDTSSFVSSGVVRVTGNTVPVFIVTEPVAPAAALNPGEAYTLRVVVGGSPQFRYQWQKRVSGGSFVDVGPPAMDTDLTESSLVFAAITEEDQGEYRVLVTNRDGFGSTESDIVFIDVNDPPLITTAPANLTLNPGSTATFTVVAETPPGLTMTYQWRRGTTLLNDLPRYSGANTDTLTITDIVEADQSSFYNVVITNAAGATTSGFVTLDVNNPITITSQPKDTVVNDGESATVAVSVAVATTIPVTYQWQWNRGVEGGGFVDINDPGIVSNTRTLVIPDLMLADSGFSVRVRVFNVVGDVTSEPATVTVVEGGGLPRFLDQPASQTVLVGSTLQLVVRVGGDPEGRVIQWKRGRANVRLGDIKSAGMVSNVSVSEEVVNGITTRSTLTITNISPALMGEYSAVAINEDIEKIKDGITSDIAQVAVVSNDPEAVVTVQGNGKEKAVMSVVVKAPKGVEILYEWLKDGIPIQLDSVEEGRITGLGTSKLTISQVVPEDRGIYSVRVTGPGDDDRRTVEGGTHELRVYTEAPLLLPVAFPPAMVGAFFEYQIPADFGVDGSRSPVTYRATGLPPGLKLDRKTGWIRGVPTVAVTKSVTISLINKIKPVATTAPNNPLLVVQPIPAGAVGMFAGWIPRHELNGDVGGRFDLKTTAKGTYTGKVTIGLKAYPFKGVLDLEPANQGVPGAPPSTTVTVLRKGKPVQTPMTLTFVMNPILDRLASASLTADGKTVSFTAWRNLWSKLVPATPYVGYHTFALMPPDGPANLWPMGDSFGYFTVRPDGKLTMAVKMADGQAFTGGQFVGPLGEIMIYKVLYKTETRGSVVGQMRLNKNNDASFADNSLNSVPATAPTWLRPADPAAKAPVYADGFGPITLTVTGGAYEDPTRKWPDPEIDPKYPLILGLPNDVNNKDNAMIAFTTDSIGHIGGSSNLPTRYTDSEPYIFSTDAIDIVVGNKVIVPKPGSLDNPYETTLSVTAKTGLFRGNLKLEGYENDELTARRTKYQGIIVLTSEGLRGVGYYLAPDRLPEPGVNSNTFPKISNQVYLAPYTAPVPEPETTP